MVKPDMDSAALPAADTRRVPREIAWVFMLFLGATGFSPHSPASVSTPNGIEICLIVLPVFTPILSKLDFAEHLGNGAFFMAWFGLSSRCRLSDSCSASRSRGGLSQGI